MCVSVVHPVAILSAVFFIICSLLMCVSDASGEDEVACPESMYVFHVGMMDVCFSYVYVVVCLCRLRMSSVLLVPVMLECQMCIC